jgi:hypothetical protein
MNAVPGAPRVRRGLIALLVAVPLLLTAPPVHAADTDIVTIPDANLKTRLNAKLGSGRPATQDITVGEAAAATGTLSAGGPFADLTGLEAFTNLTTVNITGFNSSTASTFTSLQPLAGLTKLTSLTIQSGNAPDLRPLAGLTELTQLTVRGNEVTDPSPLAPLTKLTSLTLNDNRISNLNLLPQLPNVGSLTLSINRIVNPAPLLEKIDPAKLANLSLGNNRIKDASSLAPLGSGRLVQWVTTGDGLLLQGNQITDFTPFDSWAKPPHWSQTGSQKLYVGAYRDGGIVLPELKQSAAITDPLKVDPPSAGTYDPVTRRLTITDPSAASVTLKSMVPANSALQERWTVFFSLPPLEPGDVDGPQVGVANWDEFGVYEPLAGPARLTQRLAVNDPGRVFAASNCPTFTYQWFRDGEEIEGTRLSVADARNNPVHNRQFGFPILPVQQGIGGYHLQGTDVGHHVSVRATCDATGVSSTSAPVLVLGEAADQPFVQDAESITTAEFHVGVSHASYLLPPRSGVVGDTTNPTFPIYVGQADAAGQLADPSQLQVRFVSARYLGDGPGRLTADDIQITGTGAERTITITPDAVMYSVLTFEVEGTTGKVTEFEMGYKASRAINETSRVLLGSSDASSAIAVGDGHLLVADDENRNIRLYDATKSGREVAEFPMPDAPLGQHEMDTEASARKGNSVWWFGSHGKDKDGKVQKGRHAIAQMTLTGTGANAKLVETGVVYQRLVDDLIAWDARFGDRFGFAFALNENQGPSATAISGLNLEGTEFSRDGQALWLAFRSPLSPRVEGGNALMIPLTNLEDLTSGAATKAEFGEPLLLDLGGDSIREIRKNDAGEYLILSARAGHSFITPRQALWAWNGDRSTAPRRLTSELPLDLEEFTPTENNGAWEGIGQMPERLAPGAQVRLLMDQGYARLYGDGQENKDDGNSFTNKARTDLVTLAGAAGTVAGITEPAAFAAQAANTIGSPQAVTVTNRGSNVLHVGRVLTTDQDGVSADEFLVSGDTCSGQALDPDETCTVRVRFAPSRQSATSTAKLVVESDVLDGSDEVALAGTSTTLPKGDAGTQGSKGDKGDTGAQGPQGPAGPVTAVSGSQNGPTITVDRRGRLVVRVRNAARSAKRVRLVARATIGGRKVTIARRTVTLRAGASSRVTLTVSRANRRKIGRRARPLTVTATPLGGGKATSYSGEVAAASRRAAR